MIDSQKRGYFPRFFVLVCFSLVLFLLDTREALYIYNEQSCLVGSIVLEEKYFIHTYIHSINKSQVIEKILVQHDGFVITESMFKDYSTGIDSTDVHGFKQEGEWFVLTLNRETPILSIAVSPIPGHALIIKKQRYPLIYFSKINTILVITNNFSLHIQ